MSRPTIRRSLATFACLSLLHFVGALAQVSPDGIFPVAQNAGSAEAGGVNLFTGDVNLPVTLMTVQGRVLSYPLRAMYNSRSAYINNSSLKSNYVRTALGGYGWKLMDYPKLAQDGGDYYLLTGQDAIPLTSLSSSGATTTYAAGGSYHLWKITRNGTGSASDTWALVTGEGNSYSFTTSAVGSGALIWNLTAYTQAQWGDALSFQYSGSGDLVQIGNLLGDVYQVNYTQLGSDVVIDNVTHLRSQRTIDKVQLGYTSTYLYGITANLLTSVTSLKALAPMNIFGAQGAPTTFSYHPVNLADWAGTYSTATKFGGQTGTWNNGADLVISADGQVTYGGATIQNPQYGDGSLTWSTQDGNSSNADVSLKFGDSNQYFWGSQIIASNCFTGSIQSGSSGALDFRGESSVVNENAGALGSLTEPLGAIIAYTYQQNDIQDRMVVFPVVQYALDDGYDNNSGGIIDPNTYTAIGYTFSNAGWSGDGTYAQYNAVQVFPGGRAGGDQDPLQPYGSRDFYFLNGDGSGSLIDLPSNYDTAIVTQPAVRGLTYRTATNAQEEQGTSTETSQDSYWEVGYVEAPGSGPYARIQKTVAADNEVPQTVTYQYNDDWGLPIEQLSSRENPQMDATGDASEATKTSMTYAFEKYPQLGADNLHILTPVVIQSEMVQPAGSQTWQTVASQVTQWTQWGSNGQPQSGSGNWAQWQSFAMNSANADPDQVFDGTADPSDWRKNSEVLFRTPQGDAGGSEDVNGQQQYVLFGASADASFPIAAFTGVDPYSNQAFYYGFESYESFDPALYPGTQFSTATAHSGARSLSMTNLSIDVNIVQGSTPYIFSGWFKASDDQPTTIQLVSDGSPLATRTVPAGQEWAYADLSATSLPLATSTTITVSIQHSGSGLLIDDIRFAPLDESFSATVFDSETRTPTAALDTNGGTIYTAYDAFDRPIGMAGPAADRKVRAVGVFYNSRQGNEEFSGQDAFSQDNPNMNYRAVAQTGGAWEGFQFADTPYFPASNLTNMEIQDGLLVSEATSGQPASAIFSQDMTDQHYVIALEVIPNNLQSGEEIGLVISNLNGNVTQDIRFVLSDSEYKLYNASTDEVYRSESIQNVPQQTTLLLTVHDGNHLFAYSQARFLFDQTFEGSLAGQPQIYSTNTYSYCDNFFTVIDAMMTKITFDATLRDKQTLRRKNSNELLVFEKLYGGPLNLHTATTKETLISSSDVGLPAGSGIPMSFISNFAIYDPATLQVRSDSLVAQAFGYDNPFDLSTEFDPSPLLRTSATGSGGEFSANQNGTEYAYGSNKGQHGFEQDTLLQTTMTNPDDHPGTGLSNTQGYGFFSYQDAQGNVIQEQQEYDSAMRNTMQYQPNYFESGRDDANYYIQKNYSFIGNQTTHRTPDAGTATVVIDPQGRRRFAVDANGLAANPNQIQYWMYDSRGRPSETGYYSHAWDQATLQGDADSGTYPDWPSTWQKRYGYNGDGVSPDIGHLTTIQVNNDDDDQVDVLETMRYDIYGNVQTATLQVTDFTASYTVAYSYNLQNNVTAIDGGYPEPVIYQYNRLNQITAIGTSSVPVYFAAYVYQDKTVTETLNNGNLQNVYQLNAAGWVDSITSPLFSETLTYTSGGLDGSGYFSGLIASSISHFGFPGAPADFTYRYKYDAFGRLIAGYVVETDQNDLNYALYDDNGNIEVLQRWKDKTVFWNTLSGGHNLLQTAKISDPDGVSTLYSGTSEAGLYDGLAIDSDSRMVYWADSQNSRIMRVSLDGGTAENFQSLTAAAGGLAIDPGTRRLYWTEPSGGAIRWRDLDDTAAGTVFSGQGQPVNLAIDSVAGKVYWPDASSSPNTVKSSDFDGSNIQTVWTLAAGAEAISGFALDTLRGNLYWAGGTTIQHAAQDGTGSIATLYSGGVDIQQISLDIFNREVFWSEASNGRIQQILYDGTGVSTFKSDLPDVQWIAQNLKSNIYSYGSGTNRLAGTQGQATGLAYDANGNLISDAGAGIAEIGYLPYIDLTQSLQKGNTSVAFQYGGSDQRVLKTASGEMTLYLRGMSADPVAVKSKTSGGPTSSTAYVYGPTGLIAMSSGGQDFFILKDHLGSVRVMADSGNAVSAYLSYSPYGELMTDASHLGSGAPPVSYRYTGQEFDSETELYNYNARFYDPDLGRFLAPDQAGEFAGAYVYVGNNPIVFSDPTGLWSWWGAAKIVAGAALEVAGGVVAAAGMGVAFTGIGIPVGGGAVVGGLALMGVGTTLIGSGLTDMASSNGASPTGAGLDRSGWTATPLADDRKDCRGKAGWTSGMSCWKWDDQQRDHLNMNSSNLNFVTDLHPGMSDTLGNGRYIFVYRKKDDRLLIRRYDRGQEYSQYRYTSNFKQSGEYMHVRHSQVNGGWEPLWCAGEMKVSHNEVACIDNNSGHFKPKSQCLGYVEQTLQAWGISHSSSLQKRDVKSGNGCY